MNQPDRPQPRPADDYSRDQLTGMLRADARINGTAADRAAVHLLTPLEVIGTREFAAHVTTRVSLDPDLGGEVITAVVTGWEAMRDDMDRYTTPGEFAMITLAASTAAGLPARLRNCYANLLLGYVTAVAEAVLIATGTDGHFHVATQPPGPGVSYGGTI